MGHSNFAGSTVRYIAPKTAMAAEKMSLPEWFHCEMVESKELEALEGDGEYRKFMKGLDWRDFKAMSVMRAEHFGLLKYGYITRASGYLVGAFSAQVPGMPIGSIYALALWPVHEREGEPELDPRGFAPEYVVLSSTFTSCDGEYRQRMLWWPEFLKALETARDVIDSVDEYLQQLSADEDLLYSVSIYADPNPEVSSRLEAATRFAEESRLEVVLLSAVLLSDYVRVQFATLPEHTHPNFKHLLDFLVEEMTDEYKKVLDEVKDEQYSALRVGSSSSVFRMECGIKLAQLSLLSARDVGDVRSPVWREDWVAARASDLVINGICPGCPLYGNWTYFGGVGIGIFENDAATVRQERSDRADAVVAKLREARAINRPEMSRQEARIEELAFEAVEFAQSKVVMSDAVLATVVEHAGNTLRTLADVLAYGQDLPERYLAAFSRHDMAARYLFDLAFSAGACHAHGWLHGDLHLHNVTLYSLSAVEWVPDGAAVAFTLGGATAQQHTYVFPHEGVFGVMIDWSRAIIAPAAEVAGGSSGSSSSLPANALPTAAELGLGPAQAAELWREQAPRAVRTLERYLPTFARKHEMELRGLYLTRPVEFFYALCCVDFIALGRNYEGLLGILEEPEPRGGGGGGEAAPEPRVTPVDDESRDLASRLEKVGRQVLIRRLSAMINAAGREEAQLGPSRKSRKPSLREPPAAEVFGDVFAEWRYKPADLAASRDRTRPLVDVFNMAAGLKYRGGEYARFPPWARLDRLAEVIPPGVTIDDQMTSGRGAAHFFGAALERANPFLAEGIARAAELADPPPPGPRKGSWLTPE